MPTIPTLKQSFLHTQSRLLSTPLSISSTPSGPLTGPLINEVIQKVNALIRTHNFHLYPAPALRHVAEQIDAHYWAASALDEGLRTTMQALWGAGQI
ncbi:hypothetical protein MMC34_007759 [Xylographa carneopallida]|nr:hypothetical protein [Xylographa carneopallida]